MKRIARNPRVTIEHPRRPEPSRAMLWAVLEGKREDMVEIAMSEQQLIELADEALKVALILRREARA